MHGGSLSVYRVPHLVYRPAIGAGEREAAYPLREIDSDHTQPGRENDVFDLVLESIEKGTLLPVHRVDTECELEIAIGGFDNQRLTVERICADETNDCNQEVFHGDPR